LDSRALVGLAGSVVETMLPFTESAPSALLADFLVSFGSAVGRGPTMFADGAKHELKLFVVIVGATSRARKGTSRANMKRLFDKAAPQWSLNHVLSGLSSGEGLIAAMAEEDDVIARRLMVFETEFGRVLTVATRAGNTLPDYIRQLWDGDTVRILNKKRVTVDGAFFSLVGHITAEELRAKMSDVDIANGFANRVLWVYAERSKLIPAGGGLPQQALDELADQLSDAVEAAQGIEAMRRSRDAEELWRQHYEEMAMQTPPGMLGAITSRAEAQALRLSMVYAALDGSSVIESSHVAAAYAFWRYCEDSAAYVFGQTTGNPLADAILKALEATPEGRLSRSEINATLFHNNRKASDIARAVEILVERGRVREERGRRGTPGRPPSWVVLVT
jgi:hypothetical protein